jgi:hypothetical protein
MNRLGLAALAIIMPGLALAQTQPTASEVFRLRTECAVLADKILENDVVGYARHREIVSRYDPRTNRCYARIDTSDQDKSVPTLTFNSHLYDAQTREMLAWYNTKGDRVSGFIVGGPVSTAKDYGFAEAQEFISVKMSDDR